MSFSSPITKKRLGLQAGLILLASVVVGIAFNALNPVGLRWSDPQPPEPLVPVPTEAIPTAQLYQSETISARLVVAAASPASINSANVGSSVVTAVRTTWAKAQLLVDQGEVVLVDSRPRLAYKAGHIPGAINLPLKEVDSAISDFLAFHSPPDARLVIYCSNQSCSASSKLAVILTETYGYDDIQYVPGGYLEWLQAQNSGSNQAQ